ncbi:MAG: beta strand repeat-containing protein [Bacteroidota bacterium]
MKKILPILALIAIPFSPVLAQPANDNCNTATSLGSLPTPAACPSGNGAVVTQAGTTVNGTPSVPYPYMIGCSVGTNMQAPAIDVWYSFVATGTVLNINITSTFANPNVGVWTGTCGALTGIDCGIGTAAGNLSLTIGSITPGATYYIQVSGNTTTATGTFTLNVDNDVDCNNCLQTATFTATPAPVNGTYLPGQTVTFCYNVTSYTEVSQNWLHGIQYTFGAGWNLASLVATPPAQCPYDPPGPGNPANGTWGWYNSVTSSATGNTYGPGFFFEYLGDADANPGNNFGDATNGACTWNFCITLTANAACVPGQSLDITINTLADGESGSWTSPACAGDPNYTMNAIMNCCGPPTMTSTNVSCFGASDGTATATPTNTATPWDYVWVNSGGTTVSSTNNVAGPNTVTGLPADTYTVTVTDNNGCVSVNTVTITQPAAIVVTAGSNSPVCEGQTINLTANTIPGATYSWTGPGGYTSSAEDPSIAGATTANAGVYTVTATVGGCSSAPSSVTVTVNTAANAGTNGTATFCSNSASANLFSSLGGTPQAGGTWTGPSALGGGSLGTYNPATCAPGVYTYTVTGTAPCPNATATVTVTENTAPNAGTNGTITVCSNGAAVNLFSSLGGTPNAGGTWTGPSALTGGSSGTFTPGTNTAGTYTYTVTGTAPCANATATVTVTVNTAPNAGTNGTATFCSNSASANLFSSLGGTPSAGGTWTGPSALGGGSLGTYNPATCAPGVYTYTVTGTAPCANATATVTVTENTAPNAGTNGTITVCSNGAAVNLFSSLGGTPSAGGSWTGPSALTGGSLGTFTPGTNTAGVYTYTVTGTAPCANATATVTVTVNAAPTATASSNTPVCTGQTINLDGNNVPGATYSWTGPNGFTSTSEDPTIPGATAVNAGNYSLTITLNGCTSSVSTTNVVVTATTDATITPAGPFCSTDPATILTAATAGGNWSATCGACINAATGSFDPSIAGSGSWTVTYIISGSCGSSDTETIVVNPAPTATAGSNSPVCEGQALNLTANTVAGATYSWTGPNGFTSSAEDPTINPATSAESGNYTVTITQGTCSASSTVAVTVSAAPIANAGGDVYLCNGQSATLNATGTGTPVWVPATGLSSATVLNPVTSATSTTNYILTLTIGNCTDADTVTVNVTTPGPLTVSNDTSICIGDCVTFSVSGADYYSWSPSTGLTDTTAASQTVCPNSTITYTVTGYTVSVNSVANGDFESGNTGFSSDYTFTPPPNGGEGEYWVATGPQVSTWNGGMTSAGDHTTGIGNLLIVNGAGTPGNDVWCQTIVVQPNTDYVFSTWVSSFNTGSLALLQFSINGNTLSTPFSAPNTTNTWTEFFATWNSGSDTVATICIVNQNTSLGGNDFGIDDIFFSAVCETTEQITITVNTTTDATITPAGPFCANAPAVTLTAATGGGTWTGTGITNGTTGTFDPAVAGAGTHQIIYTIPGSCGDADTISIVVNALPNADAGNDVTIGCIPNTAQLDGTGSTGGATYNWTTSNGNIVSGGTSTTPTVDQPGTYILTVTQNGCSDTDTVNAVNSTAPNASFFMSPSSGLVIFNTAAVNNSTGTGLTYQWNSGNGGTSTGFEPAFQYDSAGTYVVTLIVTDSFGCTDTSSVTIIVYDEFELIIPNVFSPNGDGANDEFELVTKGVSDLKARIYNRWGQQVGEFSGLSGKWAGNSDGKPCPEAVYYYVIDVTRVTGETEQYSGHVTLVR